MKVTDAQLIAAVRKAAEVGLIPRWPDPELSEEAWRKVELVVQAAIDAGPPNILAVDTLTIDGDFHM